MCFLKTLKSLDTMLVQKQNWPQDAPSQENVEEMQDQPSYLNCMLKSQTPILVNKQDQMMFNLLSCLRNNTSNIIQLGQKLQLNEHRLNSSFQELNSLFQEGKPAKRTQEQYDLSSGQTLQEEAEMIDAQPLVERMFGKKNYKYRLELTGQAPTLIYKERNINIPVQLKNKKGQKVLNSNIMHLCLGVCDSNGQWVTENKAGENFMKGKTEMQLYHGQGSFLKIYPRQVSRGYQDGKLNFVIYAKPSVLQFTSNSSSLEREVDSNLIEPLLIKDICIRAKKKE